MNKYIGLYNHLMETQPEFGELLDAACGVEGAKESTFCFIRYCILVLPVQTYPLSFFCSTFFGLLHAASRRRKRKKVLTRLSAPFQNINFPFLLDPLILNFFSLVFHSLFFQFLS